MIQTEFPNHGAITGPLLMIGLGSIGRGTLPLLERHFTFDPERFVVIDPNDEHRAMVEDRGYRFIKAKVTRRNYKELLAPYLTDGAGQGFCVNLSVDTSSLDLMKLCRTLGVLYIDTVIEPWPGFYFDAGASSAARTNFALRETIQTEKRANPGGTTAVSCCGANPGMVSWFVKQGLLDVADAIGENIDELAPGDRDGWAKVMQRVGVRGIHIAERDTQRSSNPKPPNVFVNTWSVEGFISEGLQPAEMGWGTAETWMPENAKSLGEDQLAIFLEQPGGATRVRTWCPTLGPQYGFLVTHNESVSIADYFTVRDSTGRVSYRPTCHYAYHPANNAVLSLHEMFGNGGMAQPDVVVMDENDIVDGIDELGVLLYGHDMNAYWFGSQLSIEETRALAPYQNATGLQVTSAVIAGVAWALQNPQAGIVETDEMDFRFCLDVQRRYLGPVKGYFTDWTPLTDRLSLFDEDLDLKNAWALRNTLVKN